MRSFVWLVCFLCMTPFSLWAQGGEDTEARLRALEDRIHSLESQVQSLQAALTAATPAAAPQAQAPTAAPATVAVPAGAAAPGTLQGTAATLPVYGGATSATKALNPDISVIGNFIAGAGRNPLNPFPSISARESEFGFQAILDPYARGDFFLSFGEEGVEVEEGYITFPALPGRFSLRAGRMRSTFGKVNAMHNHVLPWVDRPLVTFNLLGGDPDETDAGIKDAGFSLSRIIPAPGGLFLEATGELYRGDSGSLFKANRRSDVSTIDHLRAYRDLSESTNLEIGGSYGRGHNELGTDFVTQLFGVDATVRWKPLRRAIYHSFLARTEFDWSRREDVTGTLRAHGFYNSADYQLGRRWFLGGRFDWSERARDPHAHDSAESLVLTYWPSEFSQIRGQLRRTNYAEGFVANEFFFQFLYSLGAHGAHPF